MAKRTLDRWLDDLRGADPSTPDGRALLIAALETKDGHVIARAATLARDHGVQGLTAALVGAWGRLLDDAVARDPGCAGKLAVLEALDEAAYADPDLFRTAARYTQLEPVWGKSIDTAGGIRSRGAAGLIRLYEPDALDVVVDHLVDPEVNVRSRAAGLLADHRGPAAAALLRLKVRVGDAEDEVTEAALSALLEVTPDAGLALGAELLGGASPRMRQLAGLALGASRLPAALPPLLRWLDTAGVRAERQAAMIAVGLLRHPDARARLLDVVATGAGPDAHAAIEALAIQKGDPDVFAAVRAAAARSRHDLSAGVARWFGA